MKKLMMAVILAATACGGVESSSVAQNQPATIGSITATPLQPNPGQVVTLAAVVRNPSGDAIDTAWTSDCGGTFADSTSANTTWTAPAAPTVCKLQLEIFEAGAAQASAVSTAAISVSVVALPPPPPPPAPQPVAVYESYPSPVPPSLVSEGFQATSTAEFGDAVTLAGTARHAVEADLVMVTWSLDAFTHPITLNLYHPDDLTRPFAAKTQQFAIPARPPADPSCSDGRWLASDGCHYGYAFPIAFDITDVTLPDTFVFGIAFDTQSYGAHPMGQDGAYNSLNIGLFATAPTVGARTEGTVYMNSSWTGAYQGTGTAGQFGADTNWDIHVPARFTALP